MKPAALGGELFLHFDRQFVVDIGQVVKTLAICIRAHISISNFNFSNPHAPKTLYALGSCTGMFRRPDNLGQSARHEHSENLIVCVGPFLAGMLGGRLQFFYSRRVDGIS